MNNDQWLKSQCERYVNGYCGTLACLRRGGYKGELPIDFNKSTCEPHEIFEELKQLRHSVNASFFGKIG
mgnify:CR=1 FL=1